MKTDLIRRGADGTTTALELIYVPSERKVVPFPKPLNTGQRRDNVIVRRTLRLCQRAKDTIEQLQPGETASPEWLAENPPDLWHLARFLIQTNHGRAGRAILRLWHLTHDLIHHLQERSVASNG